MQCTGIPVLAVGTNKVDSLLVSHMQEGRKLKAQGETELRALPFNEDFVDLCRMMWEYRVSHKNLVMPEFLPFALHHHTQGLLHFFNALVPELFEQMAGNEGGAHDYVKGPLDTTFVDNCANKALLSYQNAISVLRRNAAKVKISEEEYRQFEHLLPPRRLKVVATEEALAEQQAREQEEEKGRERDNQLAAEKAKPTTRQKLPDARRDAKSQLSKPGKSRGKPVNSEVRRMAKSKDPHAAAKEAGWVGADLESL
jgi:hypothetical protein